MEREDALDEAYDEKRAISVLVEADATDELIAGKARRDAEVFIGSIASDATEMDVRNALSACGAEKGACGFEMMTDRESGRHRGYAFARYESAEHAAAAIEAIEAAKVEIAGVKIRVSVKPNKTRVFVGGIRKDATRAEIVAALRTRGAGLEFFELAKPRNRKGGGEEAVNTDHNGGHGWATYYNEACAERFMKNMKESEEKLPIANENDTRGMTVSWAAAKATNELRSIHVRDLNATNATEEALREIFGRFGNVEDVQLRTDREPHFAWVTFSKPSEMEKALSECEPIAGAPAGAKGGSFISSLDGATLNLAPAKSVPQRSAKGASEPGKGGPSRGGRDDWSKYRTGVTAGRYGGGLAPRGSWTGRAPPANTMPVILPTGQVAYAMMPNRGGGGGRRGGSGGGGRRDNRHRPY